MKRRSAWALGLALVLVLLAWPAALAEYRGSDLVANVSPQSQVAGALMDRYPLSAYALDYHVDVGVTDPGGVPAMIAQWLAAQLWSLSSLLVKTVIDLFTWAFSLDLLGGGNGALSPIAQAIRSLYANVIGQAWLVAAVLVAGIWGMWKALVQRRYTETAGGLALSVVFVVVALFFVYQPERTIGEASRWTNTLSLAFLSGANRGSLDDPGQAKRQVADHLFETLVLRPWVVLEFGGLDHCVDTRHLDADGFPHPVGAHDPTANVCRDHVQRDANGFGGYAPLYLRWPAGSHQRDQVYAALRDGKGPDRLQQAVQHGSVIPPGQRIDKADAPAVDIQQAGGAFQRLTFSAIVLLGSLGAVVLLGFLSLAVILAQIVALVLLGFAPVALVIGVFPGAGHDFFRGWLARLGTAVFIKAVYSLVIAIVVAVSAALGSATGSLGFLFAFGLQTIFFWAIFAYRKQLAGRLVHAGGGGQMPRTTVMQKGAHAATRPVTALVGVTRGGSHHGDQRQESVLAGTDAKGASEPSPTSGSVAPASAAAADGHSSNGNQNGGAASAPEAVRLNGSTASAPSGSLADRRSLANGHAGVAPASVQVPARPVVEARRSEPTPRAMHEDLMRRAGELRPRERSGVGPEEHRG